MLSCLFLLFASSILAQDTTPKEVFKKASPSVVIIFALDVNDQPVSMGSGFYTRTNLVATNLHVVRNAKKLRIFSVVTQKERHVKGVHAISAEHDLAVLQMDEAGEALDSNHEKMETGDPIYAIGNPRGLEASLSTGIVSAVRTLDKTAMLQITAPISPGSSGGPVLNAKAQVVGISTSYIEEGQNLNFAVNVKHLDEVIASNAHGDCRSLNVLATSEPANAEKRRSTIESVRVVSPDFHGSKDFSANPILNVLTWDLSFKNDGDKVAKNFDLLILVVDDNSHEIIHFVRKQVEISVPPKLGKRTHLEEKGLDFETFKAGILWHCVYRILNFDVEE